MGSKFLRTSACRRMPPGNRLRGVITDRDLVVRVSDQGLVPDALTVGECGSDEPATVSPRDTLERAARRMEEEQVRRLPVTEAGRVIGILSHSDLAAHGADRRASRRLERLVRCGGDRRSARWLLDHPTAKSGGSPTPRSAVWLALILAFSDRLNHVFSHR
jgi:CBS domain containing-hemolysin-like protein